MNTSEYQCLADYDISDVRAEVSDSKKRFGALRHG
jgi:hypothetical protein